MQALTQEQLQLLHKHSIYHRQQILASQVCGCFYCETMLVPSDIKEWTDNTLTAMCPKCGIDSVLPDSFTATSNDRGQDLILGPVPIVADVQLSASVLRQMRQYFF